jgi:hypothetical protein
MGCGCKNKTVQTPQPQAQTVQSQPNPQAKTQATNESVQDAIRKTIEKYYNQNKK